MKKLFTHTGKLRLNKKRTFLLSSFVVVLLLMFTTSVSATQDRSANFSKNYTLTGNGATDIVNIARAQVGKTGSNLGYSEEWCANFVSDCARLAGQSAAIPADGYCPTFSSRIRSAGGTAINSLSQARAGDIVFFGKVDYPALVGNEWHVGIVSSVSGNTVYTIEGNINGTTISSRKVVASTVSGTSYSYVYFVRPNYNSTTITNVSLKVSPTETTVGNKITLTPSAKNATHFNLRIIDEKNETVFSQGRITSGITWTPTKAGTYTAWVSAVSGQHYQDSARVKITVKEEAGPKNVAIHASPTVATVGENINLTVNATNANRYKINIYNIDKDSRIIRTMTRYTTENSCSMMTCDLEPGYYVAKTAVYNDSSYSEAETFFTVKPADASSHNTMSLSGCVLPELVHKQGNGHVIDGTITSDTDITEVTMSVFDHTGERKLYSNTKGLQGKTCNLYQLIGINNRMDFMSLTAGMKTLVLDVKNSSGTERLLLYNFLVSETTSTSLGMPEISLNTTTIERGDMVTANWKAVSGAAEYFIYLTQSPHTKNDTIMSATTRDLSYSFQINNSGTYKIYVLAREGDKVSLLSEAKTIQVTGVNDPSDPSEDPLDDPKDPPYDPNEEPSIFFQDVLEGDWYYGNVYHLAKLGIVNGKTYNLFVPNGLITRAELAKILAVASGHELEPFGAESIFEDCNNHWAKAFINWAYENGVANGKTSTDFAPNDNITRQELATMLGRYNEKVGKKELPENNVIDFVDTSEIANWAFAYVMKMQKAGIINGYQEQDGTFSFRPNNTTTRAEVAKMISIYISL